jgi:hypothetical protein
LVTIINPTFDKPIQGSVIYATAIGVGVINKITLTGEVSIFVGNRKTETLDGTI